ncbi:MAG TPA: type II toxin-antitoxin system RelB/DinJ family antitoxin [Longimicrobiales bacterium]|nr:type II toxin-antitoxin system RelB/DinJ family antitoxin [Longimicrobiales bacterium]
MGKTATARARLEPEIKEEAEKILGECGLSASEAIGMFYRQVILRHGLPFPVQNFNEETRTVLRQSEKGLDVARFDSAEALFEDLGICAAPNRRSTTIHSEASGSPIANATSRRTGS